MPYKLDYQLFDQIASADDLPALSRLLQKVAEQLGAFGFFGGIRCIRPVIDPIFWFFSSDTGWSEAHNGFESQLNDPLGPWDFDFENGPLQFWNAPAEAVEHIEFWEACKAAQFNSGLTLKIQQAPAWSMVLNFAASRELRLDFSSDPSLKSQLNLIALSTLHCLVCRVMPRVVNQSLPKISSREINCLKWAARGNTASEIGVLMGLSEATVVFHLNNLMKKLKVNNRTQAIAVGISMGLTL